MSDESGEAGERRNFLKQALALGAAGLMSPAAWADEPPPGEAEDVTFPTSVGPVKGYLASPRRPWRNPPVLVMHGNFGQPDYQRRIADELARAGFLALAAERFSRIPGFSAETLRADDRGERRYGAEAFFREEDAELAGAAAFLLNHRKARGRRIGAVGFCGGGIHAVRLSLAMPAVAAVVAFYTPVASSARFRHPTDPIVDLMQVASRIRAPLQIHYGSADYVVKAEDVERLAGLVRQAGTEVEVHAYEGAMHGFYQTPREADAGSVLLARARYLNFLGRHLRQAPPP